MDMENSLESTPSWAVAAICTILILLSLLIEHALHILTKLTMICFLDLVCKEKEEKSTRPGCLPNKGWNLGFISLLLTMANQPISKICIPRSLGNSLLPCKDVDRFIINGDDLDYCGQKGKVPLVSAEGIQQLQMFIIVLAVIYLVSCLVTLGLGVAKMKQWESWEKETRTLEHQLSNDPRRFMLARQTSFGQRHLTFWSNNQLILWLVCFLRQFTASVSRADYFALRNGFVKVHISKDCNFDFHKFLRRSLDLDFAMVVRISHWIWTYVVLFIFFSAHVFYNHYWLPFVPLLMLLAIGTKLEVVITKLCLKSTNQLVTATGEVFVNPNDNFFWFGQPKLILHVVHFILIQNSFQLAFFTWTYWKFGFRSCYHRKTEDFVLNVGMGILVQFMCAYVTLPLYAMVTQMGSSVNEAVFTDEVVESLKRWLDIAKRSVSEKKSTPTVPLSEKSVDSPSSLLQPLPCTKITENIFSSSPHISKTASKFKYPSGRLELLEIQRVAEEIIECSANNIPYNGEISFRMWRKQGQSTQKRSHI